MRAHEHAIKRTREISSVLLAAALAQLRTKLHAEM